METEKTLNTEESLGIIHKMISTAREDVEDSSFYFLIWGWLVFAACLCHFALIHLAPHLQGIGWMILMPAGAVATIVYGIRQDKRQRVRSYTHDLMKFVLIAFLVTLFVVLVFMGKLGLSTYPMVMLVYGMWLFISGGALRFKPLIAGGIINWVLGVTSFFFAFEYQLMILALAVLLGYIIPGHMLRRRFAVRNKPANEQPV